MVAYTVSQRTKEIGIRVALGARPAHVVTAIVRQFRLPIAGGAIAGCVLAAATGAVLSRELFGVSPIDPLAHGGALLLFALVSALAGAPSVRRLARGSDHYTPPRVATHLGRKLAPRVGRADRYCPAAC
jgi:ABC-type antimicrobial peptide transport system permease subunit